MRNPDLGEPRFTIRPAKGEVIEYDGQQRPIIEFFDVDGAEYPVIEHPLATPPELTSTGALGFDPKAKVIKMRGVPEEFRTYGYFNEVQCPDVLAQAGACRDALEEEVPLVPQQQMAAYLQWRINFFDGVYRLCRRMATESTDYKEVWEQYAREMLLCVEYLRSL